MNICPITLQPFAAETSEQLYSNEGLESFHPKLKKLELFPFSLAEQIVQAGAMADKMSIQGVQPKLSAKLSLSSSSIQLTERGGTYILKPNPPHFQDVPANEALTMSMAKVAGIEVPAHGIIQATDGSWVYIIKRFDRIGRNKKLHQEDFTQLSGASRFTKYDSSLERVAKLVESYCSFPAIELPKLATRLLFSFLTGNEDMHLKNFSIIQGQDGVATLSPAYDLLNSSIVLTNPTEESALTVGGKKSKLSKKIWVNFLYNSCKLSEKQVANILTSLEQSTLLWKELIDHSYLPETKKEAYRKILEVRQQRLF